MCFRARERGDNKGRARFERGFSLLKNSSRVSRPILFSWFHNRGLNVSLFETQERRISPSAVHRDTFAETKVPRGLFHRSLCRGKPYGGASTRFTSQRYLCFASVEMEQPERISFSSPFRTLSSPSNKSKEESKGLEVDGGISRPSIIGDSGMRRLLGVYWNNTEKREGRNLRIFGFQILRVFAVLHRFKKKKGKKHEDGKDLVNPSRF